MICSGSLGNQERTNECGNVVIKKKDNSILRSMTFVISSKMTLFIL